jgi:hypothetical protein
MSLRFLWGQGGDFDLEVTRAGVIPMARAFTGEPRDLPNPQTEVQWSQTGRNRRH